MAIRIRRREFVVALGGAAAAWPLPAHAQQRSTSTPRIGIIDDAPIWDHLRQGLRDLGYIEGQNISFEYRSAEGQPDRLVAAARELASLPVDVIATNGSAATRAAHEATAAIPIVMIAIGDPVRAGFVPNLARPTGNVTGNTILGAEMTAKRVQLLKEFLPRVSRVAFLWNTNNGSHLAYLDEWRAVAPTLGIEPLLVEVNRYGQFEDAFAAMMRERPDALCLTADPFHVLHIRWIIDFVAKHRLPTMYVLRENVAAGGLMSYGPSLSDLFRRAAGVIHANDEGVAPRSTSHPMAQLPVLATPQEAKKVWDRQQRPSARGVARALTQAGRPVHFTTINRWRRQGWRAETTEHPLTQARDALDSAIPVLTGEPKPRSRARQSFRLKASAGK